MTSNTRGQCYHCQELGHFSKDCPHRQRVNAVAEKEGTPDASDPDLLPYPLNEDAYDDCDNAADQHLDDDSYGDSTTQVIVNGVNIVTSEWHYTRGGLEDVAILGVGLEGTDSDMGANFPEQKERSCLTKRTAAAKGRQHDIEDFDDATSNNSTYGWIDLKLQYDSNYILNLKFYMFGDQLMVVI
ncbi:hypothetical protein NE237_031374 [Protea cynaroides]|uniref:CCHC-type domain-containing protein n=1 Tax=Protea cynaroides TaxID=273540 RepID=A0A9Q0L1B8_9MAGN|nr:hypothetical protein NE237_031374 [Protea cynaroides]